MTKRGNDCLEQSRGAKRPMSDLKLKTATRTQGNNKALKDGAVKPKNVPKIVPTT